MSAFAKLSMPAASSRRTGAILLIVAALWGWFDVRKRARVSDTNPAVHKTDITVYTEAGAAMFDGRDPYLVSNPRGWHYLYPPLFAILMSPLSLLPTTEQALVWYALSCLCLYGSAAELRRLWAWTAALRQREIPTVDGAAIPPAWLAWTVVAGVALPVLNCLQRGQVGVCIVYFLLLGARLVLCSSSRSRLLLGGIVLALPVTIKLTPLLPAAVLAGGLLVQDGIRWIKNKRLGGRGRSAAQDPERDALGSRGLYSCTGGVAGLLLWFLLVPAVTIGLSANEKHLRTWMDRVVANNDVGAVNDFNFKSKRNQSLDNGVRRLGNFAAYASGSGPEDQLVDRPNEPQVPMPMETLAVDRGIKLAVLGLLLGLATLVVRAAWSDTRAAWPAVFGLGCAATVVVSPLSWGHHFVMLAPAMLFVPALYSAQQSRAARWLAGSAAGLMILHYLALEYVGRVGLLGIGMSVWGATAIAVCYRQVKRLPGQSSAADNVTIEQSFRNKSAKRAA